MLKNTNYRQAWDLASAPPPVVDPAIAAAAARATKQGRIDRLMNELSTISMTDVMRYTRRLFTLWEVENIAGFNLVKAYTILRYMSFGTDTYRTLLQAVVRITLQANGFHPDHDRYSQVPLAERANALAQLEEALLPYGNIDLDLLSRQSDTHWPAVQARIRAVEEEARRVAEEARVAEDRRRFQERLNREAVVFKRDPEGSIDLKAFALDSQSIHRSSVQTATEKAVHHVLTRPLTEGQETLVELTQAFTNPKVVRWAKEHHKEESLLEVTNDYYNTEAFSIRYGVVLDHVWAYINPHEHRKSLCIRLAQEIYEGRKMCSNGKMARLINVLQGFDDTLDLPAPPEAIKLMFQNKIARLIDTPLAGRRSAAMALFQEYNIPEAEHALWLEPLLDQ
jgi:hypothetical protein